ncbi:MAG TPA: hypothetical protein VHQ43_01980 [Solirubrobacterales bacterium]|nr:hypothetical protein [Solirubrobacterales bacterium]
MSKLVTQGLLDLAGKQVTVMAEVTFQRVTVDDDPILIAFARDTVPEVLAICMHLVSKVGYHDRDVRQYLLEFRRQPIDCVDDQGLELIELRSIGHVPNDREPRALPWGEQDSNPALHGLWVAPEPFH